MPMALGPVSSLGVWVCVGAGVVCVGVGTGAGVGVSDGVLSPPAPGVAGVAV
jgi:hypothetical protein